MTKAIGYVRRSTDKQDESLDQQREKLKAFAKARGWSLVEVYADDAISGSDLARPGLLSLMQRATTDPGVDVVLAWDRNRLARPKDAFDGVELERRLRRAGKRIIYAATGMEADGSFASGLIGYVEHYQNGDHLRKLGRDTMRGIVSRVQRGLWPGGPIPYGYDRLILGADGSPRRVVRDMPDGSQLILSPTTGDAVETVRGEHRFAKLEHELCKLVPSDPVRVRAVQKLFADYAAGVPVRVIRDEMNRSGLRTVYGRPFAASTINPMLENPAYLGECVYNRRTESKWHRYINGQSVERADEGLEHRDASDWLRTPGAWEAIIDRETFEAVQARRKASKESKRATTGKAVRCDHLLVGLLHCGVCGGRMYGQVTTSGKGYRTRYYICGVHHKGDRERCPKRYTVPADLVEQHIIGLIRDDLARLRDDAKLHEYIREEFDRLTAGQGDQRQTLQRRLAELDQQLAKMREHLRAVDAETAKSLGLYDDAKLIGSERAEVERLLSLMPANNPTLPGAAELRKRAGAAFDQLERVLSQASIEEKREMLALYVQTIKADPDTFSVRISLYPSLFNSTIAGAGFEPATSGL